jgi:hypothetical protein
MSAIPVKIEPGTMEKCPCFRNLRTFECNNPGQQAFALAAGGAVSAQWGINIFLYT